LGKHTVAFVVKPAFLHHLRGFYREYRRETVPLYHRAAPPPDDIGAGLEVKLRAALARLVAPAPDLR